MDDAERHPMPPYVHAPLAGPPGTPVDAMTALSGRVDAHEARSQHRYEHLLECFHSIKGKKMPEVMDKNVDNVRIDMGRGFDGGCGWGGGNPGFAAAIGGALGAALFRRLGFGEGGEGGAVNEITTNMVLSKLGNIEGQIGIAAAQVQNGMLEQTLSLNGTLAGVKDAVTNTGFVNLTATNNVAQAVQSVGCSIKEAVNSDGEKTRSLLYSQFQTQQSEKINALAAEVIELRNEGRTRQQSHDLNLNITQLQNQVQSQAQAQQQVLFERIASGLATLTNQSIRQGEVVFNSGTMRGSGNQSAATTAVG